MALHYYYSVVVRKLSIAKNKSVNTNPEMAKNWAIAIGNPKREGDRH
ncbi:MAG: hypothetical protein ACR2LR_16245 [Hassallia sp.]